MTTVATVKVDGHKIRDFRLAKGWPQRRLAREIDLSHERLNRLERSNEPLNVYDYTAVRLARALGVDVSDIKAD